LTFFRGTESINSVLADLEFWQTESDASCAFISNDIPNEARIHHGFAKTYSVLKDEVQGALNKLVVQYPSYKIVFGGHSLGGAVSLLAATDFVTTPLGEQNKDRVEIYTFG
jgi:surfactin synthase thioesterase subunit